MPRDMKRQSLAFQQQFSERRIGDTEGACLDARAVSALQRATHMRVLDAAHTTQAMRGKDEAGLWVPRSIRTGAIEQSHEFKSRAAG